MVVLGKPARHQPTKGDTVKFVVTTRDVDCSTRRAYKTRAAAVARFESMLGYTMQSAIEEHYYDTPADKQPKPDTVRRVRGVSNYGTVVVFEEQQS